MKTPPLPSFAEPVVQFLNSQLLQDPSVPQTCVTWHQIVVEFSLDALVAQQIMSYYYYQHKKTIAPIFCVSFVDKNNNFVIQLFSLKDLGSLKAKSLENAFVYSLSKIPIENSNSIFLSNREYESSMHDKISTQDFHPYYDPNHTTILPNHHPVETLDKVGQQTIADVQPVSSNSTSFPPAKKPKLSKKKSKVADSHLLKTQKLLQKRKSAKLSKLKSKKTLETMLHKHPRKSNNKSSSTKIPQPIEQPIISQAVFDQIPPSSDSSSDSDNSNNDTFQTNNLDISGDLNQLISNPKSMDVSTSDNNESNEDDDTEIVSKQNTLQKPISRDPTLVYDPFSATHIKAPEEKESISSSKATHKKKTVSGFRVRVRKPAQTPVTSSALSKPSIVVPPKKSSNSKKSKKSSIKRHKNTMDAFITRKAS